MRADDIKNALENYYKILSDIRLIEEKIEIVNADRLRVGGWLSKVPENPRPMDEVRVENLHRLTTLEDDLARQKWKIGLVDEFVKFCPDNHRAMVMDKYLNRMPNYELAIKYRYSVNGMLYILNNIISAMVEQL